MVDVMGKQVKGRTVIYIAVTLRTVAGGPAVLQRAVCVMAGGTVIVLDVVATIHKGLAGGYCRCMTAGAVSSQRHITGAGMIDTMITPHTAAMTGRTVAADGKVLTNRQAFQAAVRIMTAGTAVMNFRIPSINQRQRIIVAVSTAGRAHLY